MILTRIWSFLRDVEWDIVGCLVGLVVCLAAAGTVIILQVAGL
jgi:hypothetical protein